VIIPTYNSERSLDKCLASLNRQTYKNIEAIVVDKFSTDKTADLAKGHGARFVLLDSERACARNLGLSRAKGEYVLFLDSDMELSDDVVRQCINLARTDPRMAGIVIPERSVGSGFWVRVREFERRSYRGTTIESSRFFRKDLADLAGGYDQELTFYEESTLPQKIEGLGYRSRTRVEAEILHREDNFSLIRWLAKKYAYGKTLSLYRRKYRAYAQKQTSASYRLTLFLRTNHSNPDGSLFLGLLILKWLELVAMLFGEFTGRIWRASPVPKVDFRFIERT